MSGASQKVLGDCSSGHLSLRVWDPVSSSGDAVTASQQGEGMRQVCEEMLNQETRVQLRTLLRPAIPAARPLSATPNKDQDLPLDEMVLAGVEMVSLPWSCSDSGTFSKADMTFPNAPWESSGPSWRPRTYLSSFPGSTKGEKSLFGDFWPVSAFLWRFA